MAFPGKAPRENNVFGALLERAGLQGFLTVADLLELDPASAEDAGRLLLLAAALRLRGATVLDDEEAYASSLDAASQNAGAASLDLVPSDDTISLYLKEMSLIPLLSLEEEISLAERVERARQARIDLVRKDDLSGPARKELEAVIRDGEQARDYLIRANTRLVVSVARKYTGCDVPFLDLIQEGNLGLMKAVEKFEYRRGFRFSTYATWWIRQSITRAIADQSRTIRVPVHMSERLRQLYRAAHELEQELGRAPNIQELASRLGLDSSKVQWMLQVAQPPLSLETPVGDDEDSELGVNVEDVTSPSPSQLVHQSMLHERVEEVLATLSPREARILCLRFGLGVDRPYTLEEVGQKFGLTRERIRQIEGKALRRLRQPSFAHLLREYV